MTPQFIRSAIRDAAETIRRARWDRSTPALLGEGFTVRDKSGRGLIRIHDAATGSYNLLGSWNGPSHWWTRDRAERIAAALHAKRPDIDFEVVHWNQVRDDAEETNTTLLRHLWQARRQLATA